MNSKSTDSEADAFSTTPSRQLIKICLLYLKMKAAFTLLMRFIAIVRFLCRRIALSDLTDIVLLLRLRNYKFTGKNKMKMNCCRKIREYVEKLLQAFRDLPQI